jgi:large subunit ribosomal protein L17
VAQPSGCARLQQHRRLNPDHHSPVTKRCSAKSPKFADRASGYTRIISAGNRVGDGAKVAILEIVGYEFKKKEKKEKEKTKKEEPVEAAS